MAPILSSITPNKVVVGDPEFILSVRGTSFTPDCVISFGGQELSTVYVDETYLYCYVDPSNYSEFSLGGLTVSIRDVHRGASNSTSFAVERQSPISLADFKNMIQAMQVPTLDSLLNAGKNEFTKAVKNVQIYRILQGDNLQSIAARMTGEASNWQTIADINHLRYPYISEDPNVLRNQTNFKTYLTRKAKPGDKTIYVNGLNQLITIGCILYFNIESPLTNGKSQVLSDMAQVQSIEGDKNESKITLTVPLYNTYEPGFGINILSLAYNTSMKVATKGDLILVPSNTNSESFVQSTALNKNDLYAMLGEDIGLDRYGHMWADNTGDLLSFNGLMNLHQAIEHRMVTEKDELHYHPSYGNRLLAYIGSINNDDLLVFSQHEISRTLLDDPRIRSVSNVSSVIQGDVLLVSATAEVDMLNISQNFNFVIKAR